MRKRAPILREPVFESLRWRRFRFALPLDLDLGRCFVTAAGLLPCRLKAVSSPAGAVRQFQFFHRVNIAVFVRRTGLCVAESIVVIEQAGSAAPGAGGLSALSTSKKVGLAILLSIRGSAPRNKPNLGNWFLLFIFSPYR